MAVQAQLCSKNMGLPMCGSQDWLMSSVLGIDDDGVCFQEPPQQTTLLHQGFQFLGPNTSNQGPSSSSSGCNSLPMEISQYLALELEKQRLEIDWFLQLQKERLRTVLLEESRKQAVLLERYGSKMMIVMRQKDEDLAVAKKKTTELQDCLVRAEMEAKAWQKMAIENEAVVLGLNNRLNQVRERDCLFANGAQDAESFCDSTTRGNGGDRDQLEGKEEQSKKMGCKLCHARSSCVVFLPCRHLCSCKSCEALLGLCPVCESVKKASIEVFLV